MSMQEPSPVVPRPLSSVPRKPTANPVEALTNTSAAAGRPWWAETFSVAVTCGRIMVAPLKIAASIADAAVACAFLGIFGLIGLWWMGYIPDEEVAKVLGQLGDRGLAIIQASGIL